MPSVRIENVPDDVCETLRRRADAAGQSLQAYVLTTLEEEASRPTIKELFERAGRRTGGSVTPEFAARVIREERDARSA